MINQIDSKSADLRTKNKPGERIDAGSDTSGTEHPSKDGMTTVSSTGLEEVTPGNPVAAGQTTKM